MRQIFGKNSQTIFKNVSVPNWAAPMNGSTKTKKAPPKVIYTLVVRRDREYAVGESGGFVPRESTNKERSQTGTGIRTQKGQSQLLH
jgi:hypothetical protein